MKRLPEPPSLRFWKEIFLPGPALPDWFTLASGTRTMGMSRRRPHCAACALTKHLRDICRYFHGKLGLEVTARDVEAREEFGQMVLPVGAQVNDHISARLLAVDKAERVRLGADADTLHRL